MKKWNKTAIFVAFAVLVCASVQALSPEELLIHATRTKNIDKLQDVFKQEINPNYTDANGKSALMYACENEWYEGVKTLLEKDVDVDASDKDGKTALMYACEKQWYEGVKVLLEKGVDVNASKKDGETAFLRAVQDGNIKLVRLLVYEDANINASGYKGKTALMYAIENQCNDIVDLLLRRRADCFATDMYGDGVAMYAVKYKNGTLLKKLLKNSFVDWNKTNNNDVSPFALACMDGDLNIVKQILQETSTEVSACRILDDPIIIWLIANKKSENIIRYLIESCSPKKILSMTDIFGHDIKYWAEKQKYWNILALLAEIERKELR